VRAFLTRPYTSHRKTVFRDELVHLILGFRRIKIVNPRLRPASVIQLVRTSSILRVVMSSSPD